MDTVPQHAQNSNLKRHYVYTLAYPDGTVFYVGKGIGKRIYQHEWEARSGKHVHNHHKANTIKKIWEDGGSVLKTKVAYFDTHEEAVLFETALIFFLPNLTNLTDGGDGSMGRIVSEETRRKHSQKTHSEETKRRWSEQRKGVRPSEETRRKLSEARKGKRFSEEHRRNLAEAGRRRPPISEETRRKISLAKTGKSSKRSPMTEETKRKIGDANRGRVRPPLTDQQKQNLLEGRRKAWERKNTSRFGATQSQLWD